jgi:hypothetical protein
MRRRNRLSNLILALAFKCKMTTCLIAGCEATRNEEKRLASHMGKEWGKSNSELVHCLSGEGEEQ